MPTEFFGPTVGAAWRVVVPLVADPGAWIGIGTGAGLLVVGVLGMVVGIHRALTRR